MENETLRKLQLTELEIAKEIKRVCDENNIHYFIAFGTLLGAIRHKGFIPWDDDMDIGMMRVDYERFCEIAPQKLSNKFYLQTWFNDENYPLPFAKVRKKGTIFVENKSKYENNNGIYVDIFPFDYAPNDDFLQNKMIRKICLIERLILMKNKYQPWSEDGYDNLKKKIGYIPYRLIALFLPRNYLISKYNKNVLFIKKTNFIYPQMGIMNVPIFDTNVLESYRKETFEGEKFNVPIKSEYWLEKMYGDYMKLPPEDERENRHQALKIYFGD